MRCARCGTNNPEGSRFCMGCGWDLAARPPAAAEQPPDVVTPSRAMSARPPERRPFPVKGFLIGLTVAVAVAVVAMVVVLVLRTRSSEEDTGVGGSLTATAPSVTDVVTPVQPGESTAVERPVAEAPAATTVVEEEQATPVPVATIEEMPTEITEEIIGATPTEIAGATLTPEVSIIPARLWHLSLSIEYTGTLSQTPGVDCGEPYTFHTAITAEMDFEVLRRTLEGEGQVRYTPVSFCVGDPCQEERFECIGPINPETGEPDEYVDTLLFDAYLSGEHTDEELLPLITPADFFVSFFGCRPVGVDFGIDPGAWASFIALGLLEIRVPRVANAVFEETGTQIVDYAEMGREAGLEPPEGPGCPDLMQYHYRVVATPLE